MTKKFDGGMNNCLCEEDHKDELMEETCTVPLEMLIPDMVIMNYYVCNIFVNSILGLSTD